MIRPALLFIICFTWAHLLAAQEGDVPDLMRDLVMVRSINRELDYRFPVTYNNMLQGGTLQMPSARMGDEGEISFGYSSVPPYRSYNLRVQLFENFELTGNYRIFSGILDPVFGHMGFGEFSDKGANIKLALLKPEDSDYALPGIAVGLDDFIGTKGFEAQYIVATQVLPRLSTEISVGYGSGRIKQWFGGLTTFPFGHFSSSPLRNLAFTIEYDAIDYKNPEREPHPDGRNQSSKFNFGLKYRLWDLFDFTGSYVRGEEYSFALSATYNLGRSKGFLPKIDDPLPYTAPKNTQEIGVLRPEAVLAQDFNYAFRDQGFLLLGVWLTYDASCRRVLRMKIWNCSYLFEHQVRCRLNHLLANLTPETIDKVVVVLEGEGCPIQEYSFHQPFLKMYSRHYIGDAELNLISPISNVTRPDDGSTQTLFKHHKSLCCFDAIPKVQTFFGSTTGKFKYALGLSAGISGYLPYDLFYSFRLGWLGINSLENLMGVDRLNPSQLINVHTDIVCYYQYRGLTVDQMYLQKNANISNGWFARASIGHFSQNYGGIGGEVLYYPVNSPFAIGFEAAILKKRTITGIGFTDTIRKFDGFIPEYVPFTGFQYFVDLYYNNAESNLGLKISAGKFLAQDVGLRYEVTRTFPNGVQFIAWYTRTNGNDMVNGSIYFDKGVGISVPLDFFYTYSCRKRWNYAISAWLRDVGYRGPTGRPLYDMIHNQRI